MNKLLAKNRLLDALRVLESIKDADFTMASWCQESKTWNLRTETMECHTIGCVVYHYCQKYPERDLKVTKYGPIVNNLGITESLAGHFEITKIEASELFLPIGYSDYVSRQDVIDKFKKFLKV